MQMETDFAISSWRLAVAVELLMKIEKSGKYYMSIYLGGNLFGYWSIVAFQMLQFPIDSIQTDDKICLILWIVQNGYTKY